MSHRPTDADRERNAVPLRSRDSGPSAAAAPKRISSAELFSGAREILIDHSGVTYTLRRTSLGKLILTK